MFVESISSFYDGAAFALTALGCLLYTTAILIVLVNGVNVWTKIKTYQNLNTAKSVR